MAPGARQARNGGGSSRDEWKPGKRLLAQWTRHVRKLVRQLREENRRRHSVSSPEPFHLIIRAEDVSRYLTVTDGDGFMVAGLRVRLHGMDAPEYDQTCLDENGEEWPCGKKARWRLYDLLRGRELEVRVRGVDRYGRLLATCLAEGRDVSAVMVRQGWAVAYGAAAYRDEERKARNEREGIWRGACQEPESWRAERRALAMPRQKTEKAVHAPEESGHVPSAVVANASSPQNAENARPKPNHRPPRGSRVHARPASGHAHADDGWNRLRAAMTRIRRTLREA